MSIVSVARMNAALAAASAQRAAEVDVTQDGLTVRGNLGSWAIQPGAAGAFLNINLPLVQTTVTGLPGAAAGTDISGVVVQVKIALILLPAADARRRDLRFDLAGLGQPGRQGIVCTGVIDTEARLPDSIARQAVGDIVAAALAAHGDDVAYVLATVGGLAAGSAWLEPTATDWCYLETVSGEPYLALLSVVGGGSARGLDRAVDPTLLQPPPNALLAVSETAVLAGSMLPAMQRSRFGVMRPRCDGNRIVTQTALQLPAEQHDLVTVTPHLDSVTLDFERGALVTHCTGHCDLPLGSSLDFTVTITMPYVYDAKTRTASFQRDPRPQETHKLYLMGLPPSAVPESMLGAFIGALSAGLSGQITSTIQSEAAATAALNSPPLQVVAWVGVPFAVTAAQLSGAFVFADRPAPSAG